MYNYTEPFNKVLAKLKVTKELLTTFPKCNTCEAAPAKYNYIIKDSNNKVIPTSFFYGPTEQSNNDTITT